MPNIGQLNVGFPPLNAYSLFNLIFFYFFFFLVKLGKKHPDPVVETASLSSVEPCDVYYDLSIPQDTIQSGQLSALQLESITYASQAHEHLLPDGSRAGFLIGDGAGVGKGRTIAGIIYENYMKGRKKALWISVSNDLKYDAERDLSDIGAAKIEVNALNKVCSDPFQISSIFLINFSYFLFLV